MESKKESPEWIDTQKRLEKNLAVRDIQTWIAPLLFEKNASETILRCPNQFFLNWIKSHFTEQLNSALAEAGLSVWRLELMTEEQLAAAETANQKQRAEIKPETRPQEDVDELTIKEQFERLYQVFPRKEKFDKGLAVFLRLGRQNALPKVSGLIRAVKRGMTDNPSWQREQGRFIPQIHNWLSKRRWLD